MIWEDLLGEGRRMGRYFVFPFSPCWDSVWLKLVRVLCMLSQSLRAHMCICPIVSRNSTSLKPPTTSSSCNLPTPSSMWISEPRRRCDKDSHSELNTLKSYCLQVVQIVQKETSLGGLSGSLIYGYSNTSLGDILLLCLLAV